MGHYDSPEDAYFAFFERFTAEDAAGWAACMSYPHVRVAPPREGVDPRTTARYYPTPEDYAAAADWSPFKAAGWVRTQGVEPVRLHESDDMVHLLGGWTRYNKHDEPIVSNRVTYLLTRLDSGWGIQARFGIDTWLEDGDTSASEQAALGVVQSAINHGSAGDFVSHSQNCHFPLIIVGPGAVTQIPSAEELIQFETSRDREVAAVESSLRVVQSGRTAVNIAIELKRGDSTTHELVLVTQRDGKWGITGASAMQV